MDVDQVLCKTPTLSSTKSLKTESPEISLELRQKNHIVNLLKPLKEDIRTRKGLNIWNRCEGNTRLTPINRLERLAKIKRAKVEDLSWDVCGALTVNSKVVLNLRRFGKVVKLLKDSLKSFSIRHSDSCGGVSTEMKLFLFKLINPGLTRLENLYIGLGVVYSDMRFLSASIGRIRSNLQRLTINSESYGIFIKEKDFRELSRSICKGPYNLRTLGLQSDSGLLTRIGAQTVAKKIGSVKNMLLGVNESVKHMKDENLKNFYEGVLMMSNKLQSLETYFDSKPMGAGPYDKKYLVNTLEAGEFPNLEYLKLSICSDADLHGSEPLVQSFGILLPAKCPNMKRINFQLNNKTLPDYFLKEVADAVSGLRNLTDLSLSFNQSNMSEQGLDILNRAFQDVPVKLQAFKLSFSAFTYLIKKSDFISLSRLIQAVRTEHLLTLSLQMAYEEDRFRYILQESGLEALAEAFTGKFPNLKCFKFNFANHNVEDAGVQLLIKGFDNMPKLEDLEMNVGGSVRLTDTGLVEFSRMLESYSKTLKKLNLAFDGCSELTDESIKKISAGISSLEELNWLELSFNKCSKVTNDGVVRLRRIIGSKIAQLRGLKLSLYDCKLLDGESISAIGAILNNNKSKLSTFNFSFGKDKRTSHMIGYKICTQISDKNMPVEDLIEGVRNGLRYVQDLEINLFVCNCSITAQTLLLETIKNSCLKLKNLVVHLEGHDIIPPGLKGHKEREYKVAQMFPCDTVWVKGYRKHVTIIIDKKEYFY